jgi:hypothetical protein
MTGTEPMQLLLLTFKTRRNSGKNGGFVDEVPVFCRFSAIFRRFRAPSGCIFPLNASNLPPTALRKTRILFLFMS